MGTIVAVAAGGALGALARYHVIASAGRWLGTEFPFGTLAVNVIGSFLLGALAAAASGLWRLSPELEGFLAAGILGAFTTFSTFALDVAFLARRRVRAAALYVLLSVVLSVGGLAAGLWLVRAALA